MLLFGDMVLTLKLAIPIIAVELLAEAGLGVLMRTVPQINVFVASIQVNSDWSDVIFCSCRRQQHSQQIYWIYV